MFADDRVGARGVDDVDVAQQLDRRGHDVQSLCVGALSDRRAVLEHLNLSGRRRDAFLQNRLAHQCVDERALAGVEFADDHDEEQLVELPDRRCRARPGRPLPRRTASACRAASRAALALRQLSFETSSSTRSTSDDDAKPAPHHDVNRRGRGGRREASRCDCAHGKSATETRSHRADSERATARAAARNENEQRKHEPQGCRACVFTARSRFGAADQLGRCRTLQSPHPLRAPR